MRGLLARAVRACAALLDRDPTGEPAQPMNGFAAHRGAILSDLAEAERLAGVATFEAVRSASGLAASVRHAVANAIHLAQLRTGYHDAAPEDIVAAELERAVVGLLRRAADHLDGDTGDGGDRRDTGDTNRTVSAADSRLRDVANEQLARQLQPAIDDQATRFRIACRATMAATRALLGAVD